VTRQLYLKKSSFNCSTFLPFGFTGKLRDGSEPRLPDTPDVNQAGVRWVPLVELPNAPLLPGIADRVIEALGSPNERELFVRKL
jgi:hypothetical protein